MSIYYQPPFTRIFGTFPLQAAEAQNAIETAAEVGYRAFDTAQMYGNEANVGAALAATGLPRDQICITTKVHPDNFDEEKFLPSVEQSVRDLGGEPLDVLLVHWPPADANVAPPLKLLQKAKDDGLARSIGVSNYTIEMLETAQEVLDAPIATNQVEFHPLLDQSRLLAGAAKRGVPLSAYCSVARGKVLDNDTLVEIGSVHGKSAAQVALRWMMQRGVTPITMSTKRKNMEANFDVVDFTLSSAELAQVDALGAEGFRITTSDKVPWAPDWD